MLSIRSKITLNASLKTDSNSLEKTSPIISKMMNQAIKDAIESFTGYKVAEMDCDYYPDDYETCVKSCGRKYFQQIGRAHV